jgi:hypothetical protein
MKKNKEDLIASLSANLPAIPKEDGVAVVSNFPTNDAIIADSEEDYEFARSHIKKLIDTTDEAIGTLHNLATDAEHPRAFEVLSAMIKTAADMNNQLLGLAKDRKKIVQEPVPGAQPSTAGGTNVTNNSIFVGTTSELQKFLKSRDESLIDI